MVCVCVCVCVCEVCDLCLLFHSFRVLASSWLIYVSLRPVSPRMDQSEPLGLHRKFPCAAAEWSGCHIFVTMSIQTLSVVPSEVCWLTNMPPMVRCSPACVADRVVLMIWMERVGILVANKIYDAWKGQQDIQSGAANVPRQPGIALLLKRSEDFDARNTSSFLWNMIKSLSWTRGDYRDKTGSDFSWQNKSLVSKHWDPSITIWQEGWRVHLDKPFVWRKDNRLIHPEWV